MVEAVSSVPQNLASTQTIENFNWLETVVAPEHINFQGMTVLITGGTRGIGAELARSYASKKALKLILTGSPDGIQKIDEFVTELEGQGAEVVRIGVDFAQDGAADEVVRALDDAQIDKIDILINNAGISNEEVGVEQSEEDAKKLRNVNYLTPLDLTKRLAVSHLQPGSKVINMGSTFALNPDPDGRVNPKYSQYKLELIKMATDPEKRSELGLQDGVDINAAIPGFVASHRKGVKNMASQTPKIIVDHVASQTPGKQLVTDRYVAEVVCVMTSDDFNVTGQGIEIDNGLGFGTSRVISEGLELYIKRLLELKEIQERKRAQRRDAELNDSAL